MQNRRRQEAHLEGSLTIDANDRLALSSQWFRVRTKKNSALGPISRKAYSICQRWLVNNARRAAEMSWQELAGELEIGNEHYRLKLDEKFILDPSCSIRLSSASDYTIPSSRVPAFAQALGVRTEEVTPNEFQQIVVMLLLLLEDELDKVSRESVFRFARYVDALWFDSRSRNCESLRLTTLRRVAKKTMASDSVTQISILASDVRVVAERLSHVLREICHE